MGLVWDKSLDWKVWDDLQSIVFTSVRRPGSMNQYVAGCLRRQLSVREAQASYGSYQSGDTIWEIPATNLKIGPPKPGDVVTETLDEEDADYTVLSADAAADKTIWTLHTRNLAIAADLQDKITIERCEISYGPAGDLVKRYPSDSPPGGRNLYKDLKARVQKIEETNAEERGLYGFQGKFAVYISRQIDVNSATDRLLFNGSAYDIRGYRNPERIDELPLLDADLVL